MICERSTYVSPAVLMHHIESCRWPIGANSRNGSTRRGWAKDNKFRGLFPSPSWESRGEGAKVSAKDFLIFVVFAGRQYEIKRWSRSSPHPNPLPSEREKDHV